MLRIARDVAWLRLGSCTDHVISAAAATPDNAIKLNPASSRKRRAKASRIEAGNWPTRGSTRSIAGMLMGPSRLESEMSGAKYEQPRGCTPSPNGRGEGKSALRFHHHRSGLIQNFDQPVQC